MNQISNIYARAITPADDHCRSMVSLAEQSRRYMGIEQINLEIKRVDQKLKTCFGSNPSVANGYATDALLRTDAHFHLSAYRDELKVALGIMEVECEGIGI